MYPYNAIKEAKVRCYPPVIEITENREDTCMQSLIGHMIQRLCLGLKEVCDALPHMRYLTAYRMGMWWGPATSI